MRLNRVLFFLVFLSTFACREDQDLTTVSTQIPPAGEAPLTRVVGTVTSDQQSGVADAVVDLFLGDQLVGSLKTDPSGQFSGEVVLIPEEKLLMRTTKEGFLPALMRLDQPDAELNTANVVLLSRDSTQVNDDALGVSQDLIKLNGQLVNASGQAVRNYSYLLLETPEGFVSYAPADENGFFEILTVRNAPLTLTALNRACRASLISLPLGPFDADTNLGAIEVAEVDPTSITLQGQALDCNGQALAGARVTADAADGTFRRVAITDEQGNYVLEVINCERTVPETLEIFIESLATNKVSEPITVAVSEPITQVPTIEVCASGAAQIAFALDGDSIYIDFPHQFTRFEERQLTIIQPALSDGQGVYLEVPGATPGAYEIQSAIIRPNPQEAYILGGRIGDFETGGQIVITEISANRLEATVIGTFFSEVLGTTVPLNGTIQIEQ